MVHKSEALLLFGAGGHGRVSADIARAQGLVPLGFLDSCVDGPSTINGLPLVGRLLADVRDRFPPNAVGIFVAVGDNDQRVALCEEATALGYHLPILQHPSVIVSPSAEIGAGSVLMPGVIVNANARIGRYCILNTGCSIDHDNVLETGVQICPGVRSPGNVSFGERCFVGTGACFRPGVKVGRSAMVGAGAVVINDIPEGAKAVGNPARLIASSPA